MEPSAGDWKDSEQEDLSSFEIDDPLAQLAADLALCYIAIEEGRGAFCELCTCPAKFHVDTEQGCELCGCDDLRMFCYVCEKSLPRDAFGSIIGRQCLTCIRTPRPPVKEYKRPTSGEDKFWSWEDGGKWLREWSSPAAKEKDYDRDAEARNILRELSD